MRRTLLEIPIPFLHINIPIYSYGFMLMIAFLTGVYIARRKAASKRLDPNIISDISIYTIISAIVGARLFFVAQNFGDYKNNLLDIFKIYQGGLVYYGGLIAATASLLVFTRLKRIPFLKLMDIIVIATSLGLVFGRIGCFLNGCCYGKLSNLPWAVRFPRTVDAQGFIDGSPAFLHHYEQGLVKLTDAYSLYIHPTQLYSSLLDLGIFFILLTFFEKKVSQKTLTSSRKKLKSWNILKVFGPTFFQKGRRKWDGEVMMLFGMLYAPIRFIVELLRADNPAIILGLTISQVISIVFFIVTTGILVAGRLKKSPSP